MPATINASTTDGPARSAIAAAVRTNKPAPIIPPMPSAIRLIEPSERFRLCSPTSCASCISRSRGFLANKFAMVFRFLVVVRYCCLLRKGSVALRRPVVCRRSGFGLAPEKINRHASQDDDQARPCRRCLINEEHAEDHRRADDIKGGHDWVTERFIGPLDVRSF